jgi:putative heme-binding domain-containing protein
VLAQGAALERQRALALLGTLDHPEARAVVAESLESLAAGKADAAIVLDIAEAAEARGLDTRLDKYSLTLRGGDVERGRDVFFRHAAAQCLRCHAVNATGGTVGPDLSHLATRATREQVLDSLRNPSATIAPGFGTVAITLKNGQVLAGVLKSEEGGTLTLIAPDGQTVTAKAADVALRTQPISAMPPMAGILSPREMRDVVEFLSSLK